MNLRAFWRFFAVLWHLFPLLVAYARDRRRFLIVGGPRSVSADQRRERARILLDSLVTLGPTFIKLGQLLSTRPDVLPPEYIVEFTKLQDRVPPAAWDDARPVIEEELGPLDESFEEFETEPISGASLGQVYRASVDGEAVAVKVRRPGVESLVEADLQVIRWILPIVMRFVDDARSFSLETLAEEFDKRIRQEMDYEREARMLRTIRTNFADDDSIRMPAVVDSHSTERVLTMEYVAGTKITDVETLDAKGLNRSDLAERIQQAYMEMIIDDGTFHADPHPGNIAVQDDGTLVLYDFGMSGYVEPYLQDRIVHFYAAIAREDIGDILDILIEMGTLSQEANRDVMGDVVELAIEDMSGESIEQYRVQQIVRQVEDTIYEFPLRLPPDLALVLRVATVVEGVCVTLDPDFDFIAVATDFLASHGYVERGVREFLDDRREDVGAAAGASLRIPPKLESVLDSFEHGTATVVAELDDRDGHFDRLAKRIILGIVLGAGIVSTTILAVFGPDLAAGASGVLTVLVGFLLYRSFRNRRGIRAHPKFTRYEMRRRTDGENALGFGDGDRSIRKGDRPAGNGGRPTGKGDRSTAISPDEDVDGSAIPVTEEAPFDGEESGED